MLLEPKFIIEFDLSRLTLCICSFIAFYPTANVYGLRIVEGLSIGESQISQKERDKDRLLHHKEPSQKTATREETVIRLGYTCFVLGHAPLHKILVMSCFTG